MPTLVSFTAALQFLSSVQSLANVILVSLRQHVYSGTSSLLLVTITSSYTLAYFVSRSQLSIVSYSGLGVYASLVYAQFHYVLQRYSFLVHHSFLHQSMSISVSRSHHSFTIVASYICDVLVSQLITFTYVWLTLIAILSSPLFLTLVYELVVDCRHYQLTDSFALQFTVVYRLTDVRTVTLRQCHRCDYL